jgi:alcohol dehydrogenase
LILPLHSRQRLRFTAVKPSREDLDHLSGLAQQGTLQTVIDSVYPLEDLAAALCKSQSGRARGKIIISVRK